MFSLDGHTWKFIHDGTGYYGVDPFGNRREFTSRSELRHMCEYYTNIGWKNEGTFTPSYTPDLPPEYF